MRVPAFLLSLGCTLTVSVAHADPCKAPLPSSGTIFSGQVRYVGDGDSLCVGQASNPATWIEVRIADFYAPELNTSGGQDAKVALQRLALGRTLQCRAGKRSYDRVVAWCTLDGRSLADGMRQAGIMEGGNGR
jgi:endonuclease YncB( thermonuclease family)